MTEHLAPIGAETLSLLERVSTGTLTTLLIKDHGLRFRTIQGVRPINTARCKFAGEAYTIRFVPIREDLQEIGSPSSPTGPNNGMIDSLPAGAVVMLDMQRETACGAMGDILVARMLARGVKGLVADGGLRDGDFLAEMDLPAFCAALSAPPSMRALMAVGRQEIIGCGGVMVRPGDIVVGDGAGVVVIPRHLADRLAKDGTEKEEVEAYIKRRVQRGDPLKGLYPPNENSRAEYRRWLDAGRPAI